MTKTTSSRRVVPFPDAIIKLKEHILKLPVQKPNAPLFQTDTGKRPTMSYLRKRFKSVGEHIGCEWSNLHTMRYTYASKLFQKHCLKKIKRKTMLSNLKKLVPIKYPLKNEKIC